MCFWKSKQKVNNPTLKELEALQQERKASLEALQQEQIELYSEFHNKF